MIRKATEYEKGYICGESIFVSEEEGAVRGHVCISRVDNKNEQECWIHELECTGTAAVELMARARRQAQAWGFTEVRANVSNLRLAEVLANSGWQFEQIVLKGAINNGD